MACCAFAPRSTGGSRARGGGSKFRRARASWRRCFSSRNEVLRRSPATATATVFARPSSTRPSGAWPTRSRARRSSIAPCRLRCAAIIRPGSSPRSQQSLGRDLPREMAALLEPAPLDLRVNLLKTEREAARAALGARGGRCGAHATLAPGPARLRARAAGRARLVPRRAHRSAGRGLAACIAPGRCAAGHARRRFLRRRRRQDAGAGGEHGQSRPSRRLRRLGPPARARDRARCAAPAPASCSAKSLASARDPVGEAPCRGLRPRAGRCALHRHRHVAAQSRREMAPEARGRRPSLRRFRPTFSTARAASCVRAGGSSM